MNSCFFLIVGLVRDCASTVGKDLEKIQKSFRDAGEVSFFLVESDSSDNTVAILESVKQQNFSIDYVSLGGLAGSYPKRTDRIAFCRNRCLEEIVRPKYRNVDYVVVADFDGINNKLTPESVRSCWNRDDWDVCCANQLGPYYDIWALRHDRWSPNDCWRTRSFLEEHGADRFIAAVSAVYSRMITINIDSDWIEVDSAFGGLAIYKRRCFGSVYYVGLDDDGEEVCEHVSIHRQIRETGGRIFINPALINAGVVEHARSATSFGLSRLWMRSQLERLALIFFSRLTLKRVKEHLFRWERSSISRKRG